MAIQLSQLERTLKRKHLCEFSIEEIFTDIGLYDEVLIDCLPTRTSPAQMSDNEYVDELVVSDDVKRFNEFVKFASSIMLACPQCKQNIPFKLHEYFVPQRIVPEKQKSVRVNVFNEQHKYVVGHDGLGIITGDPEIAADFQGFCREQAQRCKAAILSLKDIRKEGNCTLDFAHRYIMDFVFIDPEPDIDDFSETTRKACLGIEEGGENEQKFLDAYHKLKTTVIIKKIGQYPSQAEAKLYDTTKYRKILKDSYSNLTLAIQLNASGVGAGSIVYLRRIFEGLLEESHQRCVGKNGWDDTAYAAAHVNEKISLVEAEGEVMIPPEFQPIRNKLYGALSKGVHELPENECKELFPAFYYVIVSILDSRIYEEEKQKRLADVMKQINSVK